MKIHHRNLLVLVLSAVLGIGAWFIWSTDQQYRQRRKLLDPLSQAVQFSRAFQTGDPDGPMQFMMFDEQTPREIVRPNLALLSGLHRLDGLMKRMFDEGFDSPPLPAPLNELSFDVWEEKSTPDHLVEIVGDIAYVGPDDVRLVLRRHNGQWFVDPRPFADETIDLERADAMNTQLNGLAERVRAGEFATRQDALDAYNASVFLGLLGGMGNPQPATRADAP